MSVEKTLKRRQKTHGDFDKHAQISQDLKAVLWKHDYQKLSPAQCEALEMMMHKVARILNGDPNYADHWHDIAGYSTLVENSL